jgi:hypothetical protein
MVYFYAIFGLLFATLCLIQFQILARKKSLRRVGVLVRVNTFSECYQKVQNCPIRDISKTKAGGF